MIHPSGRERRKRGAIPRPRSKPTPEQKMNTGHLQAERAEAEQAKAERGHLYEAKTGNHQGLIVDENSGKNVAVTYDRKDAAELVKRWNAYPELVAKLQELVEHIQWRDEETHDEEDGPMANTSAKLLLQSLGIK